MSEKISNGFTFFMKQEGYLSKRKIKNMTSDELIENKHLLEEEIKRRGVGMLFG